jgi:preprotein translocase subunit SecG
MNVLFTILTVLVLIASALLTLIVLLQNGKGGGLASNFVAGNQAFGVRQTADILEKITWYLVAFVGIGAIVINVFALNPSKSVDYAEQVASEPEAIEMPAQEAPAAELPAETAPATETQN